MRKLSNIKGFTLVELMIVIAIIGILAATLLPKLVGFQDRARDTARQGDLRNVAVAFEAHANDYDVYPANNAVGDTFACLTNAGAYINATLDDYLNEVLEDPITGTTIGAGHCTNASSYGFYQLDGGTGYALAANTKTPGQGNIDDMDDVSGAANGKAVKDNFGDSGDFYVLAK